mmetsp:Transcript_47294/g.119821  ORF Transcript_47294/g.119821 Transcript_47294/m.119821 type:complete len:279 (+) Transcript_47294:53-889(+)
MEPPSDEPQLLVRPSVRNLVGLECLLKAIQQLLVVLVDLLLTRLLHLRHLDWLSKGHQHGLAVGRPKGQQPKWPAAKGCHGDTQLQRDLLEPAEGVHQDAPHLRVAETEDRHKGCARGERDLNDAFALLDPAQLLIVVLLEHPSDAVQNDTDILLLVERPLDGRGARIYVPDLLEDIRNDWQLQNRGSGCGSVQPVPEELGPTWVGHDANGCQPVRNGAEDLWAGDVRRLQGLRPDPLDRIVLLDVPLREDVRRRLHGAHRVQCHADAMDPQEAEDEV